MLPEMPTKMPTKLPAKLPTTIPRICPPRLGRMHEARDSEAIPPHFAGVISSLFCKSCSRVHVENSMKKTKVMKRAQSGIFSARFGAYHSFRNHYIRDKCPMVQRRTHVPHPPSHDLHTIFWNIIWRIIWLSVGYRLVAFGPKKGRNDGQTIGKWYAKWTVREGGMEMKGRWGLALCHEHLSRHYIFFDNHFYCNCNCNFRKIIPKTLFYVTVPNCNCKEIFPSDPQNCNCNGN